MLRRAASVVLCMLMHKLLAWSANFTNKSIVVEQLAYGCSLSWPETSLEQKDELSMQCVCVKAERCVTWLCVNQRPGLSVCVCVCA